MLEDKPLISVVVPTYNRAHLILDSLNSVYQQSYRPLDLIVVDDGSTDDTVTVVRDWMGAIASEDFSVRYVCQSNQGGNPARNRGIEAAKGTLVAFLDSDDIWHPEKLMKQAAVLLADEKMGGIYCGLQHVFIESGVVQTPSPRAYLRGDLLYQMLVHDVTAPTSTYMVRAIAFEQMGCFDEQLQARQDWDMWIRLASRYEIGVVPEVLVDFREHSGDRTATNPQKEIDAYHAIMEKYASLRARCPFSVRQAAKASFYRRMGRVYFHHKISVVQAFIYQISAILNWPFAFDSYAALLGMLLPGDFRQSLHRIWNRAFGATTLAIKSH